MNGLFDYRTTDAPILFGILLVTHFVCCPYSVIFRILTYLSTYPHLFVEAMILILSVKTIGLVYPTNNWLGFKSLIIRF